MRIKEITHLLYKESNNPRNEVKVIIPGIGVYDIKRLYGDADMLKNHDLANVVYIEVLK